MLATQQRKRETDHGGLDLVDPVDGALPVRELVEEGVELAVSEGAEARREVRVLRRVELDGWFEMKGRLRDWLWVTENVGRDPGC